MILWLMFLLLSPFWQPKTEIRFFTASTYQPAHIAPLAYSDFHFFFWGPLEKNLKGGTVLRYEMESPELFSKQIESLQDEDYGSSDVLILHIEAHGVIVDGRPFLACKNFDPSVFGSGLLALDSLLQQVSHVPAAFKLILLDSGQQGFDPRLNNLVEDFPRYLRQQVESTGDGRLWLLNSNSAGELSHVSPALQRSLFHFVVSRGLQGAADLNEDRFVDLDELNRYCRVQLDTLVQQHTAGNQHQRPILCCGNGNHQAYPRRLISTAGLAPPDEDVSEAVRTAQDPKTKSNARRKVEDSLVGMAKHYRDAVMKKLGAGHHTNSVLSAGGDAAKEKKGESDRSSDEDDDIKDETAAGEADSTGNSDGSDSDEANATQDDATDPADVDRPLLQATDKDVRELLLAAQQLAWQLRYPNTKMIQTTAAPIVPHRAAGKNVPINYAPHCWRDLQQQLQWYERAIESGADATTVYGKLRRLVDRLRTFQRTGATESRGSATVVERIAAEHPWFNVHGCASMSALPQPQFFPVVRPRTFNQRQP